MSGIRPRPFLSGSRQAPDPYDQYLDEAGFYRKHTARDASSLFRVISEQMFSVQIYHRFVRESCVAYMLQHKDILANSIKAETDIDQYLAQLCQPKTHGSLLELKALGYLYRRNVRLFETFSTGTWLVYDENFKDAFNVFYNPGHFDSVFTKEYIADLAFCQSIFYEILYTRVFKLPDVKYSVERMLYDPVDRIVNYRLSTSSNNDYPTQIYLDDGRSFYLDRPESTNCILDNYRFCSFHNPDYESFERALHNKIQSNETTPAATKISQYLLPDKYTSCVRQILEENITPFPYNVAKALDPDIYRNIEFDSWNSCRKERRMLCNYKREINYQIGAKCYVKIRKSQENLFNCHIQDVLEKECIVFIEELGEKRKIPFDFIIPFQMAKNTMSTPTRWWRHSYHYQKKQQYHQNNNNTTNTNNSNTPPEKKIKRRRNFNGSIETSSYHISKNYYFSKNRSYKNEKDNNNNYDDSFCHDDNDDYNYNYENEVYIKSSKSIIPSKLEPYISLDNFQVSPCDYITMPVYANSNTPKNGNYSSSIQPEKPDSTGINYQDDIEYVPCQPPPYPYGFQAPYQPGLPLYYYPAGYEPTTAMYTQPYNMVTSNLQGCIPIGSYMWTNSTGNGGNVSGNGGGGGDSSESGSYVCANNTSSSSPLDNNNYFISGTPYAPYNCSGGFNGCVPTTALQPTAVPFSDFDYLPIQRPDLLYSLSPVNYHAGPSYSPNGADVPIFDGPTVRFFYNLGHEYAKLLQAKYGPQIFRQITEMANNAMQNNVESSNANTNHNDAGDLATNFSNMSLDKTPPPQNKNPKKPFQRYSSKKNFKKEKSPEQLAGGNHNRPNQSGNGNTQTESPSPAINRHQDQDSVRPHQQHSQRFNPDQQTMYMPYHPVNVPVYPPPTFSQHQMVPSDGLSNDTIESSNYGYMHQVPGQVMYSSPPHGVIATAPPGYRYPPPPIPLSPNVSFQHQPLQNSSYNTTPQCGPASNS